MSILARAISRPEPLKATRLSVSEDGSYAVGPTSDSIQSYLDNVWAAEYGAGALNMITVYQCVRVLSNTFAQLPLMVYRRRGDGGRDRATEHPWYRALHLQPNPGLTSFGWRRLMMVHLATWGNHFAEVTESRDGFPQLYPIRPDRVEVTRRENGTKRFVYLDPDGGRKEFKEGTVFHVTALSTDGLVGRSPLADLRSTLKLAKNAETFGTSFFKNGARPATVLKHPKTLTDPAIARLSAQMEALRGSGNAGKTVVLEEGLDFSEIGIPPEDAQFMETRLFQKREIAGAYGVQLHKIADLERATFSNIEHLALEHITDTMMPWFVNAEQEISTQLFDGDEEVYAEFLVDGYLRGDAKARNEAYAQRWQHGALSSNEWRIKENDNPVPGGDNFWAPVNYAPIQPDGSVEASTPGPANPPPAEDQGDTGDAEAEPPTLSAVASAAVRCPKCNRLLAEVASPPYRIVCRCKGVAEAA